MTIELTDFVDVEQRSLELGLTPPEGACILPRHFADANNAEKLEHESSALDLKILFRQSKIPIAVYSPKEYQIPYRTENDITWVGPLLFFSASALSQDPNLINLTFGVIGNYLTDFFKGWARPGRVKLSVVFETTITKSTTKTTKRLDFDGPAENLPYLMQKLKELK